LVIELWLANGSCGKVEQKVAEQQTAVTAPQAATNQNEFVELGHRAKALGIMPHALVPSCEQYRKIAGAGAADIEEMLVMLKSVTAHDVQELMTKRAPQRLIVAYGGAMHNDLVPREGREGFSFGPELAAATKTPTLGAPSPGMRIIPVKNPEPRRTCSAGRRTPMPCCSPAPTPPRPSRDQ
jgi:hypothetical protein